MRTSFTAFRPTALVKPNDARLRREPWPAPGRPGKTESMSLNTEFGVSRRK